MNLQETESQVLYTCLEGADFDKQTYELAKECGLVVTSSDDELTDDSESENLQETESQVLYTCLEGADFDKQAYELAKECGLVFTSSDDELTDDSESELDGGSESDLNTPISVTNDSETSAGIPSGHVGETMSNRQIREVARSTAFKEKIRLQKILRASNRRTERLRGLRHLKEHLFLDALAISTDCNELSDAAHTKPGFIGLSTRRHPPNKFNLVRNQPSTRSPREDLHPDCGEEVKRFVEEGWTYIQNDINRAQAIFDTKGRKVLVKAKQPLQNDSYAYVCRDLLSTFRDLRSKAFHSWKGSRQREPKFCPSVSFGFSSGGGQRRPQTLKGFTEAGRAIVDALKNDSAMQKLVNHITACYFSWYPDLAEVYAILQIQHGIMDQEAYDIYKNSPFCGTTVNFGPKASTITHRDSKNLVGGVCAIAVLGEFNHQTSGHILLHEMKLILETRPGDVIFLPSSAISHSNSPVKDGEDRCSIVQYTAGGNFRYLWPKESRFSDVETGVGHARWMECLSMLGTLADLELARSTGRMPSKSMEDLIKSGGSLILPSFEL